MNVIIFANGLIIRHKAIQIKMNQEDSLFQDEVSDWDKKNIVKIAASVSFMCVGLMIASFAYGAVDIGLDQLVMKVFMFFSGFTGINSKMLMLENKEYTKNMKFIEISLVLGFMFNVICLFIALYFKPELSDNYQNVCDCIIAASFISLVPLMKKYIKMSTLVRKIRNTQNMNHEELF
jgi:hypothetical protein